MARQLNQYDTASLKNLWETYAARVANFEPTQRWEEAALALCMIQGVLWKNQLFNVEMLKNTGKKRAGLDELRKELSGMLPKSGLSLDNPQSEADDAESLGKGDTVASNVQKRRKVLKFEGRRRKP